MKYECVQISSPDKTLNRKMQNDYMQIKRASFKLEMGRL